MKFAEILARLNVELDLVSTLNVLSSILHEVIVSFCPPKLARYAPQQQHWSPWAFGAKGFPRYSEAFYIVNTLQY